MVLSDDKIICQSLKIVLEKCLYWQWRTVHHTFLRENSSYKTEHLVQYYFYLYICGLKSGIIHTKM